MARRQPARRRRECGDRDRASRPPAHRDRCAAAGRHRGGDGAIGMTEATPQLLACAAALLDQGRIVDRLSRLLTAAALIGLLLYPAIVGRPSWPLVGSAILVALAGLSE